MINHMEKIAELLHIEIDEIFGLKVVSPDHLYNIGEIESRKYRLTKLGLEYINEEGIYDSDLLEDILIGFLEIQKAPFKPDMNQLYYTFGVMASGELQITTRINRGAFVDSLCYHNGFCYETFKDAEGNLKKAEKFINSNKVVDWENVNEN